MRIFYFFSSYISHLTAGLDYFRCLAALGHSLRSNLPPAAEAAMLAEQSTGVKDRGFTGVTPKPLPEVLLTQEQLDFAAKADLVVLHEDPLRYPEIFKSLPFLSNRRVAAYVAWENEVLTPFYIEPLQLVSEVWSCSDFSCRAIAPHVRKCSLLPHLVQRRKVAADDVQWFKAQVGFESEYEASYKAGREAEHTGMHKARPEASHEAGSAVRYAARRAAQDDARPFVFLSVIDGINPRKNLQGLLTAYAMLRQNLRKPAILLLKQYRVGLDLSSLNDIISLTGDLGSGRMEALYACCDAYISAHHSEGWGLGLSSAMAYGKPVIATGYSGNMQFMHSENSLPVPYKLTPVSDEMLRLVPLFRPGMLWAEPDLLAFASAMQRAAIGRLPQTLSAQAAEIVNKFGQRAISRRLAELCGA